MLIFAMPLNDQRRDIAPKHRWFYHLAPREMAGATSEMIIIDKLLSSTSTSRIASPLINADDISLSRNQRPHHAHNFKYRLK